MENPLAPENLNASIAVDMGKEEAEKGIEKIYRQRFSLCRGLKDEIRKNLVSLKENIESKLKEL